MSDAKQAAINPETGTIYSRAELKAAFERVQDPTNWKNPISALIPAHHQDVTREAVIFFAGCVPKFTNAGGNNLRVAAVGYYAAVGA